MFVGKKSIFAAVFIVVFLMILVMGLAAGVSSIAGLKRAFYGAAFFTVFSWGITTLVNIYAIPVSEPPLIDAEDEKNEESLGNKLDLTVSDEIFSEPIPASNFSPLSAKQIDPLVSKVINNDPDRMAEIVRKMGFEE